MKIIATTIAGLVLGATGVVGAAGAASPALQGPLPIQIRHQVAGCHTWSVDGSPFRAAQSVKLARGGKLTITDNDVMPHQLVRLAGPAWPTAREPGVDGRLDDGSAQGPVRVRDDASPGRSAAGDVRAGRRLHVQDRRGRGLHEGHQDDR